MKKLILLLILLITGCSNTGKHFVIGIGYTEFNNDKISTRMIGTDFLNYGGKHSFGFGYHNNIIITHNMETDK